MGGCTASKLDNEDTVRRCKERRRLMKEAVYARHHLSAAHSDYLRSLRLTGSALFDFAAGEPLCVSDQTPAVLLRNPSSNTTGSSSFTSRKPLFQQPPPPRQTSLSSFSPSPAPPPPPPRSQLYSASESTPSYTPLRKPSKKFDYPTTNSTYSETPSQTSSVWNWENFYPPSPPGSDFFRRHNDDDGHSSHHQSNDHHHLLDKEVEEYEDEEEMEREKTEREEVHCSEWGDHYSTTSSDTKSDNEDLESRSEIGSRSNFGSSVHNDAASKSYRHSMGIGKSDNKPDDAGSSASWNIGGTGYGDTGGGGGEISDMKLVVRHQDLAEIAASIKDYFEKAAAAGQPVSDLLEISRAQLDRSLSQLKKTVYHSNSILTNLSSSFTSKPPLEIKYRLDARALDEPGAPKSHCSTLERLLAWEKKLYVEVKAREEANIEHEKKLSSLQTQEYRGGGEAKLDKTKASIKKLQSLIIVTSQAVSTTSSAIIRVRDTELTPQLIELCHGLMYMWRSMNQFHELQNHIVQQVRGLINRAAKGESTTDLHRQATRHLESAVSSWHSSFCRLIKYQRDYVRSLHSWLRLSLIPIKDIATTEPTTNPSDLFGFLDEWKQALDRLPDTVASGSIKSFVNVVHVISTKQSEELKIKKRGDVAVKELEKKASSLRTIEKKFYQSYSMVGIALPDGGRPSDGGGQIYDARDPLAEKKLELAAWQRKVEDEMLKYAKAVDVTKSMTLNNIQTGLPGVFQAMTMFSGLFNEALQGVCTRSYSIK